MRKVVYKLSNEMETTSYQKARAEQTTGELKVCFTEDRVKPKPVRKWVLEHQNEL